MKVKSISSFLGKTAFVVNTFSAVSLINLALIRTLFHIKIEAPVAVIAVLAFAVLACPVSIILWIIAINFENLSAQNKKSLQELNRGLQKVEKLLRQPDDILINYLKHADPTFNIIYPWVGLLAFYLKQEELSRVMAEVIGISNIRAILEQRKSELTESIRECEDALRRKPKSYTFCEKRLHLTPITQ